MDNFDNLIKEQLIFDDNDTLSLSYEEFLTLFNKAYLNDDYKNIVILQERYPDYLEMYSEDNKKIDNEEDETTYQYPILAGVSHNSQAKIFNIIEYLIGNSYITKEKDYLAKLEKNIKFRHFYNYTYYHSDKDYDSDSLWHELFLKEPELHTRLTKLRIKSFDELVYRAVEYFDMKKR